MLDLTPRELEVARLVADGHSEKVIAARLSMSIYSVGNHVRTARLKIGARNKIALARWVWEQERL